VEKIRAFVYGVVCVVLVGCGTARPVVVASDEHLVAAQISAARLAELSERIGDTLDFASGEIERIRELAGNAGAGILRALELLDLYDEFVSSLIRRIAELSDTASRGDNEEAEA